METLVDLHITYKLTGGGQNAWKDVPILLSGPLARCFNEMKKQIQMLSQENSTFKDQDIELQSLKQEKANFELKIKEKDEKISSLENESRTYRTSSIQQTQMLNSLKQEKQVMEQDKTNTTNEMERLKSSYTILEQLLEAKQDTIMSLNRENQTLLTANQGNQQGANEMVDTLKSLLQAKNSEIELNNLKMEHALDKEKEKTKKLLKENKRLKQTANSRETRPSSSTTVPEATASNTGTNEDDPNNDFNYDTASSTGHSNDDTSSEDEDHANDLNYDSDV
jgi:chromosome segregation ATPase